MMKENDSFAEPRFPVRSYGKGELAMYYLPGIAQQTAVDISGNESQRLVVDAAKAEALDATGEAVAQIALTAEQIRSEVKRDYATSDQMSQVTETLSTLAEQSENNFTWTVTKVN